MVRPFRPRILSIPAPGHPQPELLPIQELSVASAQAPQVHFIRSKSESGWKANRTTRSFTEADTNADRRLVRGVLYRFHSLKNSPRWHPPPLYDFPGLSFQFHRKSAFNAIACLVDSDEDLTDIRLSSPDGRPQSFPNHARAAKCLVGSPCPGSMVFGPGGCACPPPVPFRHHRATIRESRVRRMVSGELLDHYSFRIPVAYMDSESAV